MADFCLVSRRTLSDREHAIFKYHYLLGADWKLCCRKLKMDRGSFFHEVYRIEQKLGKTFRELEPYALFPLDEYFNSTAREKVVVMNAHMVATEPDRKKATKTISRFPLKRSA